MSANQSRRGADQTGPRNRGSRRPRRAEAAQERRREHYQQRIDQAPTPGRMVAAALDYLRSTFLRFAGDPQSVWAVAAQISKAIVRAADGLEEEATSGGARR